MDDLCSWVCRGFWKVKSQLSAWTTSTAECAEGFGRLSPSWVRGLPLQLSAQRVLEERICSLVRSFGLLRRSATECADRRKVLELSVQFWDYWEDLQLSAQIRTVVCKELNKTQLCGRSLYTGGEPRISRVVVVPFCFVLFCFMHLISKIYC